VLTHSTPLKASPHPLEHIAHRDAVTNLPNRFLLADRVRQALYQCQRRGQSLAMAYVDLDGLLAITETYGAAVCDEFLITLTQRMKVVLREGDTLARIGVEEFVAVLVDLDAPQDCEPVLSRLVSVASEPATIRGRQLSVRASIGVTLSPDGAVDVDLLLRHADQALYHERAMGKNRYQLFDLDLNAAGAF
jgi:diguanylate cyclase (GGDEF)-like protein